MSYVLGKGELWFAPFRSGTTTPDGFRFLGNCPELNVTLAEETLDHFSSTRGVREKDGSVQLQVTRSGTFITDFISPENLALFFLGTSSTLAQTSQTGITETLTDVRRGRSYQVGATAQNPTGARQITITTITVGATPLVLNTDYTLDAARGIINILAGSTVVLADGTSDISLTYSRAAVSREQVISGSNPITGAMRFIAYNGTGPNRDYYMPSVKLSPNGDFALIGEEWQQIPFNMEILKPAVGEAIYVDGQPFTP